MSQPKKPGRYRYRLRADSAWARFFDQEWREVDVLHVEGMWAGVGGGSCIPIPHHEWEWIGPLVKVDSKKHDRWLLHSRQHLPERALGRDELQVVA